MQNQKVFLILELIKGSHVATLIFAQSAILMPKFFGGDMQLGLHNCTPKKNWDTMECHRLIAIFYLPLNFGDSDINLIPNLSSTICTVYFLNLYDQILKFL